MAAPTKVQIYRAMKRLYRNYIHGCKQKNVFWGLSLEEFHSLTSASCYYCGKPPLQKSRSYKYNGIDRTNHKKGYELGNCVTSCKECNFIKGNRLTQQEMEIVGEALSRFRSKNK